MAKSILTKIRHFFNPTHEVYSRRELEYLSDASDIFDLEIRQKEIDRSRYSRRCVGY